MDNVKTGKIVVMLEGKIVFKMILMKWGNGLRGRM